LRFLEELLGDLSLRNRLAWIGVVSSKPNAGQAEPLGRDCLMVLGCGVDLACSTRGWLAGGTIVSATPTFVGNLAIERELGIPVLLDLLNVVNRRIVSGIITLGLLLGDRAADLSRCLNMAGTGLVGEGMILGNDCDAADGANCSSAQISKRGE
jgi:hypothetical protein